MGASGAGPRPWKQKQARTLFLRVPHTEWTRVLAGRKREFRASGRAIAQFWDVEPPLPVVAWCISPQRGYLRELMVLEATWRERLEDISAESLREEGQPDFAHFRRYWMMREGKHFAPTREISVYRVRPWEPADERRMGDRLFDRLYGAFRG